jgi:hypothetical protein
MGPGDAGAHNCLAADSPTGSRADLLIVTCHHLSDAKNPYGYGGLV